MNSFPKFLFIHSNYRPENCGGVESVVSVLLRAFSAEGKLSCFFGAEDSARFDVSSTITYISRRILFKRFGACLLSWGNFSFIKNSFYSNIIIFQEPYPTLWPAVLFVRFFLRKKIIVLVHANPVSRKWIMWLYGLIRSFVFAGATCVVTSPNLLKKVNSLRFTSSHVIPLGISVLPTVSTRFFKLPDKYVLYIGRISEYKGVEYLLDSACDCPEIEFVIAGDGPLAGHVRKSIVNKGVKNVLYVDRFVTDEEKMELIERSSIVAFPSISENEAFGLVQLEAMKFKKPIVNTWLDSGVNYVSPHQLCALTVERKNSKELSAAIRKLWNDSDLTFKLGEAGYQRLQTLFDEEKFIASWRSLLAECLYGRD